MNGQLLLMLLTARKVLGVSSGQKKKETLGGGMRKCKNV